MTEEILKVSDVLNVVAVRDGDTLKRYEITPARSEGFYRISEDKIEKGKVYFPGKWKLEDILSDITEVVKE